MPLYQNVGGTLKKITKLTQNVGGTLKTLTSWKTNVGGTLKEVLASVKYYPTSLTWSASADDVTITSISNNGFTVEGITNTDNDAGSGYIGSNKFNVSSGTTITVTVDFSTEYYPNHYVEQCFLASEGSIIHNFHKYVTSSGDNSTSLTYVCPSDISQCYFVIFGFCAQVTGSASGALTYEWQSMNVKLTVAFS